MFKFINGLYLTLAKPLTASATTAYIRPNQASRLNMLGVGNHIYFSLRYGSVSEVVKYTHIAPLDPNKNPLAIIIERNVDGAGIFNFPTCSLFEADLNKSNFGGLLREFGAIT